MGTLISFKALQARYSSGISAGALFTPTLGNVSYKRVSTVGIIEAMHLKPIVAATDYGYI